MGPDKGERRGKGKEMEEKFKKNSWEPILTIRANTDTDTSAKKRRARHGRREFPKDIRKPQNSARNERGRSVYEILGIFRELSKRPKRQRIAIQTEDRQIETSNVSFNDLDRIMNNSSKICYCKCRTRRLQEYLASLLRLDPIKDKALIELKERVQWILRKHRLDAVPLTAFFRANGYWDVLKSTKKYGKFEDVMLLIGLKLAFAKDAFGKAQ
ncbi:hypothetical protein RFI_02929, partial [Reticulomyxa filosa]